jgi:signal transduction histidine kinase
MKKNKKPLFWFYILVSYIFLQFCWWGVMIIELNNELVRLKTEINLLKGESTEEIIIKGNELNQKLHKRRLMIAGEGVVFISLLSLGFYQVRNSFKRESQLSLQQKNFLLSVTHELKSPIASAKLQLQTLLKHELNREKQKEILSNAIADTDRLNTLVENILLAAKIDNNIYQLNKEYCNISDFIEHIISNHENSFHHNRKILVDIQPKLYLSIDKINFPSIIINLLENAIKYSPENSTITIHLKKISNSILFSVADEGAGILDAEKRNIFKKFYRVGNEETRNTKGTGLGLYIVNYLVTQHQGKISVKNNVPKGSIFEVIFRRQDMRTET